MIDCQRIKYTVVYLLLHSKSPVLAAKEDLVDTGSLILLTISIQRVCVGLPWSILNWHKALSCLPKVANLEGIPRGYFVEEDLCDGPSQKKPLWSF